MTVSGVETEPVLCPKELSIKTFTIPLCVACLGGKATYFPSTYETPNPDHFEVIQNGDILPGDTVSTDQYEYEVN